MLSLEATLGQLVADKPARSRFFERLGMDYCCGGKKRLSAACVEKGLDPATVLVALELLDEVPTEPETDWSQASLTALADHIEATHHAYLRRELPRLESLLDKVVAAHGQHRPELLALRDVFVAFHEELRLHMVKEEQVLFPWVRAIEGGPAPFNVHCGSLVHPIRVMETEHEQAGNALKQMRELTRGFAPPADACNTFRALYAGLEELERDMHRHVHKENNILFPRAQKAEESLHRRAS